MGVTESLYCCCSQNNTREQGEIESNIDLTPRNPQLKLVSKGKYFL